MKPSGVLSISPWENGHSSIVSIRPGQRVGQVPQPKQARGSRQQEPAGPRIVVDIRLYGQQEIGDSLNLIDDRQAAEGDEPYGILEGRLPVLGEIEVPPLGGLLAGQRPDQGALAGLAGTVDEYHTGVRERFRDSRGRMPGYEIKSGHGVDASTGLSICDAFTFDLRDI